MVSVKPSLLDSFGLEPVDWWILDSVLVAALLGVATGLVLARGMPAADCGSAAMSDSTDDQPTEYVEGVESEDEIGRENWSGRVDSNYNEQKNARTVGSPKLVSNRKKP